MGAGNRLGTSTADSLLADADRTVITCIVRHARRVDSKVLYALVDVDLVVGGVTFTICGLQARRLATGGTAIALPTYRAVDGSWKPAIDLPDEMRVPLSDAVLAYLVDEELAVSRPIAE